MLRRLILGIAFVFATASLTHAGTPPDYLGKPLAPKSIGALFGCGPQNDCWMSCTTGGITRKFENVAWAAIATYGSSTHLWLLLDKKTPYLLGDSSFCDFGTLVTVNPV
jgi:hypothetical protein